MYLIDESCKGNRKKVMAFKKWTFVPWLVVGWGGMELVIVSQFLSCLRDDKSCDRTRKEIHARSWERESACSGANLGQDWGHWYCTIVWCSAPWKYLISYKSCSSVCIDPLVLITNSSFGKWKSCRDKNQIILCGVFNSNTRWYRTP